MIHWMNPGRASFRPLIEQDLQQVRTMLWDLASELDDSIRPLVRYSALDSGKLLRPILLLLSGGAFGAIGPDHLRVATILEIIHNAKLTLPLIHALRVLAEPRRTSLLRAFQRRSVTRTGLLDVLAASGSTDYVLARIGGYTGRATEALGHVRPTPMKAALLELPRVIVREALEQSAASLGRSVSPARVAAQG